MGLNLAFVQGNNQTCEFETTSIAANGINGHEDLVYTCQLTAFLDDESNQNVDVNTKSNLDSNDEVKAVEVLGHHSSTVVKFIPFSIFKVFPFMEYFIMTAGSEELEELKPGFFTGAKNLHVLRIEETSVSELVADLFKEAKNLKFINLSNNILTTVDKKAFNGLADLESLALDNNLIENMHPHTFSDLKNLKFLDLTENFCINKSFQIENGNFKEVENAIWESCKFDDNSIVKPILKPVVPLKTSAIDGKLKNISDIFQSVDSKLNNIDVKFIENDKVNIKLNSKMVGFKEALEQQKTQLNVIANLTRAMDPKIISDLENMLLKHIKTTSDQISKIPNENTITDMIFETQNEMDMELMKAEKKNMI